MVSHLTRAPWGRFDVTLDHRGETVSRSDSPRSRVLVLSLSPELAMNGRVLRQLEALAANFDVVAASFGSAPPVDVDFLLLPSNPLGPLSRKAESAMRTGLRCAGRYASAYWHDTRVRLWRQELSRALPVEAIVVNDLFALPLARALDPSLPVVFDAQEHWTSESESWSRLRKLSMRGAHEWIVDQYVPQTAGLMTVSPGIAREYKQRVGVEPALVTNAPYFQSLRPSPVSEPIRLFHVGVADERRRLEDTIEVVRSLDGRFTLDLVLARDNEYRRRLERLAASDPRISVLPPVAQSDLVSFANDYDVGVHFLPGHYANQVHALPNKLFDYIQARLAVAVGPSPAMAEVIREWDCGVIASAFTPEAYADSLARLTVDAVTRLKENADRAAGVLTAENNRETVVSLVERAIAGERTTT